MAAVTMAAVMLMFAGVALYRYIYSGYAGGESVRIYIPRNATAQDIADTLHKYLGDDYGQTVFRLWDGQGGEAHNAYGSYVIKPGDRAITISRNMALNRQQPVRLTFNNLRTFDQLAKRIASRMDFTAEEFRAACDSLLPAAGFDKPELYPAAFVPDTYEVYWTESPERVVKQLLDERNAFWTPERLIQARNLGLTPEQVATVASIVEEETIKADERPLVARLYLNRLQRGMKLQADPTVKFALGDFSLRRIGGSMLQNPSPYNTYRYEGLPPGPIRIPEEATLAAVLDAPQHDYIYMCAKEDFSGYHNFAADYPTHQANAARYQAVLNRRGIRS